MCLLFSGLLLAVFQCGRHIDYQWGYLEIFNEDVCLSNTALFVAHCISDVALDLCIILLPFPMVKALWPFWNGSAH